MPAMFKMLIYQINIFYLICRLYNKLYVKLKIKCEHDACFFIAECTAESRAVSVSGSVWPCFSSPAIQIRGRAFFWLPHAEQNRKQGTKNTVQLAHVVKPSLSSWLPSLGDSTKCKRKEVTCLSVFRQVTRVRCVSQLLDNFNNLSISAKMSSTIQPIILKRGQSKSHHFQALILNHKYYF